MIDVAASADPKVRERLSRHPDVGEVRTGEHPGIDFEVGPWKRHVWIGKPELEVTGLVELIDNNPMVCADEMSIPDPVSTLALIALGPLASAGILLEAPAMISSIAGDEKQVSKFLTTAGWQNGIDLHVEPRDLGSVCAATAMAAIPTPQDWSEIDDLYEERFGRSFYVRKDDDGEWDPSLVKDKPYAVYRLSYTPDDASSLLTIHVLADLEGKCGGAQAIHAMNVMAGFEESLSAD